MRRVLLAIAVALVGVNIWTGDPALALWVGSRTQGGGAPTMTSVTVVTVVLAALSLAIVIAVLVFEYWFFFLSGSPIDQRSGRKDYAVTSGSISSLSVSTTLAA